MDEASPTELEAYLRDQSYPASREAIVETAAARGAGPDVLDRLRNMDDIEYDDLDAVSAAFSFEGGTTTRYGHVTVYDQ